MLLKKWRQNLWRNQPFRWRNQNYILRIGNCVGLEDIVRQDEVAEAIKLCCIDSKDFILLLPEHIRKKLFIVNATDGEIGDDEREDAALETMNIDKNANGGEFNGTIQKLTLLAEEEYVRSEQQLQIGLQKELNELMQAGYYIPMLKWNPNKLSYNVPGEGRQEHMSVKAETGAIKGKEKTLVA